MSMTCLGYYRIAVIFLLSCSALAVRAGHLEAQTAAAPTSAQAVSTLIVRVTGIRNAKGKIRLALFRDSKYVEGREIEIDAATLSAKAVFEKLPQGVYAVN
jgi:uncharacterized protein (DUF2141 family)